MMYRLTLEHGVAHAAAGSCFRLGIAAGAFRSLTTTTTTAKTTTSLRIPSVRVVLRRCWRCIQCANFVFVLNTQQKTQTKRTNERTADTYKKKYSYSPFVCEYLPIFFFFFFFCSHHPPAWMRVSWCCRFYLPIAEISFPVSVCGTTDWTEHYKSFESCST